jgi:hypothetical protein
MYMKITITIPDGVYEILEDRRGLVPRSTYIQDLITGGSSIKVSPRRVDIVNKKEKVIKKPVVEDAVEDVLKDLEDRGLVKKGFTPYSKGAQTSWKHVKKVF